jgi:hypothetical protein
MGLNPAQFHQLSMFEEAGDLVRHTKLGDQNGGSKSTLMHRKYRDAQRSGLAESVARKGVQEPVRLEWSAAERRKPWLIDGHRRVASALAQGPHTLVPVTHEDWDV